MSTSTGTAVVDLHVHMYMYLKFRNGRVIECLAEVDKSVSIVHSTDNSNSMHCVCVCVCTQITVKSLQCPILNLVLVNLEST